MGTEKTEGRHGQTILVMCIVCVVALVAVSATWVLDRGSRGDEHNPGEVFQASDLSSADRSRPQVSLSDCAVVGCLENGLVIGARAVQVESSDLSFASTVFRGSIDRVYRSDFLGANGGPQRGQMFGPGWASVLDSRLVAGPVGEALVTPPTSERVAAVGRLNGTSTALWGSGELWQFNDAGRITRIESPTGRFVQVEWDGASVSSIATDSGHGFEFTTDAEGRVTEARSSDDRSATYRYDDGRLTEVAGPSGIERYRYDDTGLLVEASTPARTTRVVYDDAGLLSELSTDGGTTLLVSGQAPTVAVTDPELGVTTAYDFDASGRLVRGVANGETLLSRTFDEEGRLVRSDAPGEHLVLAYDDTGRVSRVVEGGAPTTYRYDELGRVVQVEAADGGTTRYAYDGDSSTPSTITDALGGETKVRYEKGRVISTTDADEVTETYDYDQQGNLTAITDETGAATRFGYDAAGRLTTRETPGGQRSTAEYDDAGRLLAAGGEGTDHVRVGYNPAGLPEHVDTPAGRSSFAYDDAGEMTAEIDPTGVRTEYGYANGDLATVSLSPAGVGDPVQFVVSGIGGDPLSVSGPGGDVEVVAQSEGQPSEIDLPGDRRQTRAYDAGGRLTRVTIDGAIVATYEYDPIGRLVRTGNADGVVEERTYDDVGRLTRIGSADGSAWEAAWTPAGRLASVTDPTDRTTRWSYDDTGLITEMTSDAGSRVSVEHDDDGRVSALTEGDFRWAYRYDGGGQLVTADTPAGPVDYEWDVAGRLTNRIDSGGESTSWVYDDRGRLVNVKIPGEDHDLDWRYDDLGNVSSWEEGPLRWEVERDDAGRPEQVYTPDGDRHDDYTIEWDDAGNPVAIHRGDDTERREFGVLGQVTSASYGDDTFEIREDDASTEIVDRSESDAPLVEIRRDDLGRTNEVRWGEDDDERVRAEWDHAGRPLMLSHGDDEVRVVRDDDGRPTRVQVGDETALSIGYRDGQPASLSSGDDTLLALEYLDGLVRTAESGDTTVEFRDDGLPDTFSTSGDDGSFRYGEDGTVTELRFGEEQTTAQPAADALETAGPDGDLLAGLFEADGTYRGLPAADTVPAFPHLAGLPAEFQPAGLLPPSPDQEVGHVVGAIDTTVPTPLDLDESPEDIARVAADTILGTPLEVPVHPSRDALVPLFDEEGDLALPEFEPVDDDMWAGLLGGISDRQDTTGTFDWVTSRVTSVGAWGGSVAVGLLIDTFTDPLSTATAVAGFALTATCVAFAIVCPPVVAAISVAVDVVAALVPLGRAVISGEGDLGDIAIATAAALVVAPLGAYGAGRALRPAAHRLLGKFGCRLTQVVCYSARRFPETSAAYRQALGRRGSTVLHPDSSLAAANRRAALRDVPTQAGLDRDEFPFAATREGGAGALVTHVSPSENRSAGAFVGQQFRNASGPVLFSLVP